MSDPEITVNKIAAPMFLSTDLALAYGLITEDEARARGWTPPPPVPRLRRMRWAVQSWWHSNRPHVHRGPCPVEEDW